jgi:predicted unusual protein kinase regulating ubiquinone biosynthesis (AarF/ABC1/UbiB family)
MQSFTLPAEYAFVGRALIQMNGVGKGLDPEFDFISSAAPTIYEIKGTITYLKEEAAKWFYGLLPKRRRSARKQKKSYVDKEVPERRRSSRKQKKS